MKTLNEMMYESGCIEKGINVSYPEAKSYIAGKWESGEGKDFGVMNPTTNSLLGVCRDCNPEQIHRAFKAARTSQKYWHEEVGVLEKREILDEFAHLLGQYKGELTRILTEEMGKTAYTADADVEETIHAVQHFRDVLHLGMAGEYRNAQLRDKKAINKRFPYGNILIIKPWNFLALSWWSACPSVAAGNAGIIKVSKETPFMLNASLLLFYEAVRKVLGDEAQQVNSILQLIHGRGSTTGEFALQHGDYDMVAFTGGIDTGRKVATIAANRMKRFHSELGGHGAIIVLDDFDLDKASDEIILAAFGDAGQRCVTTKVVFAQDTIADKLLDLVIEKAKQLRIGDPGNVETKLGPIVSYDALKRIYAQIDKTRQELGREPVLGGICLRNGCAVGKALEMGFNIGEEIIKGGAQEGYFIVPTIFTDVPYGVCAMDEEIFGPVLCFNTVSGRDREEVLKKAVHLVNQSPYGLSNACLTWDARLLFWAYDHTETGIWYGGRGTTGAEVPGKFGGVKESGEGREAYGLEEYSYIKQGWLDLYPVTRLAQTGAKEKIAKSLRKVQSIFS
jgi:acyl-CoA reductase-like NAD-dependent aldehyde dehydrogenase